ncbi:sensor histidine kinase [Rathayibacter agropyri]|uniref:sensor histidine kinase n=1 Tax=Rathayibacter agropyri TaxID=1634927 RepID=UPI0015632B84|nr:sensor domain-containing protein [Rathayibacter agropyri]NRD09149.1 sensor domain-containing protein [Rathayibacter agropyri]
MPSTAPSSPAQESRGTAANGWRALLRPGFLFSSWPWRALSYALTSIAITALVLPLAIVTVLIVPVWAVPFAALERRRARLVGQPRLPSGHVPIPRKQWYRWLPIRYVEATTWRDTAYVMVAIVFGILHAVVLGFNVLMLVIVASFPSALEHYYRHDDGYYSEHPPTLPITGYTFDISDPLTLVLTLVVVVFIELAIVYLGTLLALGQGALVRVLLSARPEELEAQVRDLTSSRATLVTSFDAERHSIERNLHDGVQQRLVSAALLVGTAELDADDLTATGADTARLRATLAAAHDAVEGALVDLRNTVRGIHPAVLTDHGLAAAVRELAARLPIPVALRACSTERLAPEIEACAYFVASEALTNVVRHSFATTVDIGIDVVDSGLTLTVEDDGTGGADASRGSGLAGLQERAATVGGTLDLSSPAGGPTRLVLSVPG